MQNPVCANNCGCDKYETFHYKENDHLQTGFPLWVCVCVTDTKFSTLYFSPAGQLSYNSFNQIL